MISAQKAGVNRTRRIHRGDKQAQRVGIGDRIPLCVCVNFYARTASGSLHVREFSSRITMGITAYPTHDETKTVALMTLRS